MIDGLTVIQQAAGHFETLAAAIWRNRRGIGTGWIGVSTKMPAWWDVAFFETNLDFPMNQSTLRFPHFTQGRDERERAS